MAKIFMLVGIALCVCNVVFSNNPKENATSHTVLKRSFGAFDFPGFGSEYQNMGYNRFDTLALAPWNGHRSALAPIEVANAVAAAKQASQNVLIAQQQVQAAKENVLNQQRLASERETHATILTQKKSAEAAAAHHNVVLAQQRLAAAKNAVAHQQRIAAAKEAHAISALQKSAFAEIQKTENEAARIAAIHRTSSAAHFKDAILDPISLPLQQYSIAPWNTLANPLGVSSTAGAWSPPFYTTPSVKPAFNVWG